MLADLAKYRFVWPFSLSSSRQNDELNPEKLDVEFHLAEKMETFLLLPGFFLKAAFLAQIFEKNRVRARH